MRKGKAYFSASESLVFEEGGSHEFVMDPAVAKELLLTHAGLAINQASEKGLLASLRPYRGIREEDFSEVMEALISLYPSFSTTDVVDRELPYALWTICQRVRVLAVRPNAKLVKNKLISETDARKLAQWIDVIEKVSLQFLRGTAIHDALLALFDHLACREERPVTRFGFLVPLLIESLRSHEPEVRCLAVAALGALGKESQAAVPSLQFILRNDDADEVREASANAISSIANDRSGGPT